MKKFLVLCVAALALAGCQSHPLSLLVSPRVGGRVLAADTHQPLADVKVITSQQAAALSGNEPPKGGQLLTIQAPVQTDREGRFTLATQRVLTPFGGAGWFAVQLLFEHPGYAPFQTNYSYTNLSTNASNGESYLDAGTILLQPIRK
jgi:Prokaryotic membrane lipoprotein lipid attachment site